MSLKAGRVGVAPDQVDEFGKIKSEAISGYTKQEADAKFETIAAATSALAEKQPITLAVPIKMLSGTALTVENALQGINDSVVGDDTALTSTVGTVTVNNVVKSGRVVSVDLKSNGVNISAWGSIGTIPEGYRPDHVIWTSLVNMSDGTFTRCAINSDGTIASPGAITDKDIYFHATWII